METKKDYDAIARAGWERIVSTIWNGCGGEAKLTGHEKGIPQNAHIEALRRMKADLFGGHYSNINRDKLREILIGSSDDLIERVAITLKPVNIEEKWSDGLSFIVYDWTKQQRKTLNKLIKQYGTHLCWLQKQIDQDGPPLTLVVKSELQNSAMALKDSVELSRAYIRLFDELPARWNKEGKEYSTITSHPYWNNILKSTMALIDEALSDRSNYRIGSKSRYRILADLLHLAYPWAWVANKATLKLLRGRV